MRGLVSAVLSAALLAVAAPAAAQNIPSECHGDVYTAHDDRSFESAAGVASQLVDRAQYLMLFDVGPGRITEACVRFEYFREVSFDPSTASIFFTLNVYRSEGGEPGDLIGQVTGLSLLNLPRNAERWAKVNITGGGIDVPGPVFVGVEWDPGDQSGDLFFVSIDESFGTPRQPAFFSNDPSSSFASWTRLGEIGALPSYRALAVRVRHEGEPPSGFPVADFSFAISGVRVDFQNESINATFFVWDYGDGDQSSSPSPAHVYAAPGDYEVTLTAFNDLGSNAATQTVTVLDDEPPPGTLDFGPTVFVRGGRFKIEVTFNTSQGGTGTAQGAVFQDASSLWHFFGEENIELFAKVLDGCALNGHFWVFLAGATNVGVELTVTDTQRGGSITYPNPVGQTLVTITDTEAFSCF